MDAAAEGRGETLFAIDERFTRARKRHWMVKALLPSFAPILWPIVISLPYPALQRDQSPLSNILLIEGLFCGLVAVAWYLYRPMALRVNRVAITTEGLYPPLKPKGSKIKGDWFVSYREIARMDPAPREPEEAEAWPVYDVSLVDGKKFQISPYDILDYAQESVGDKYSLLLEAIQREVNGTAESGWRITRPPDHLGPRTKLPILVTETLPWSDQMKLRLGIALIAGVAGLAAAIYSIFFKH